MTERYIDFCKQFIARSVFKNTLISLDIVFCLASLGSGGAERVVSLLANRMAVRGHQVEIICLKFNDVYYQIDPRIKVTLAMHHTKNRFTELLWLHRYLKKKMPDVVIPFTEGVYCFTILSLIGTGIPVIASERLDPTAMSTTRKILKRFLLPYADWLVVQTRSIKEYFPKRIQKKTSIIFNPVNEEVLKSSNGLQVQGANAASSVQSSKLNRIISIGRLYPQKNQEMMIRAFAKIADEFPDWQLVIYGEGPMRSSLELIVDSLQLRGRVSLPGRTEHVIEELRRSKIFCMSSDYEGMSNAMIEALCVGLPIVTTDVSGVREIVEDGINGFVVPCREVSMFGEALMSLMSNDILREKFSKQSLMNRDLFRIDSIIDNWEKTIAHVMNKYI